MDTKLLNAAAPENFLEILEIAGELSFNDKAIVKRTEDLTGRVFEYKV